MKKRPKMVEAVLFFNEQGVCRQMLFAEFEAILDRVVDLPDYAGQRTRAAFVLVDPNLQARAVVFFHLQFDAHGGADPRWNIPLRQLAERGEHSLDLGGGPVRLACASRCTDPDVREQLWEPTGSAARNDLLLIRDALLRNPFGMPVNYDEPHATPYLAPAPVAYEPPPSDAQRWYKPGPFALAPMAALPELQDWAAPRNSQADDEHNMEQRLKAARLIKQQRTLLNDLNRQCETQQAEHQEQLRKLQADDTRKQNRLRKQYDKLLAEQSRRLDALERDQARHLEDFKRTHSQQFDEQQKAFEQQEAALRQQQQAADQQLAERQRDLRLQVDINNRLLGQLAQQAGALQLLQQQVLDRQDEVTELQGKLAAQEPNEVLSRLASLGVVFVAFHPGAGHLSIPVNDLPRYQDNPMAYAAIKCAVSPERYRQWLRHYQTPRCEGTGSDGKPCNQTISRVDSPSRYQAGDSNCCTLHKATVQSPA